MDDLTYIGSSVNSNGDMDKELNGHKGKASVAFHKMSKVWSRREKKKKLPLRIKLRFYNSNILSMLLYGRET